MTRGFWTTGSITIDIVSLDVIGQIAIIVIFGYFVTVPAHPTLVTSCIVSNGVYNTPHMQLQCVICLRF